jgi:Phage tail protein (Tail_P2_I)
MSERLYNLLPEIYRTRDYQAGEPLRALMSVLESEFDCVSNDVSQLYKNWFIETCDDWVIPYIADLIGVTGISADSNVSLRAFVANTIAYRRRKGTARVVEEVARDLLARPTKVQEFEFLLAHTQHMNHLRMKRLATVDVSSPDICRTVDTAFDESMHLAEVGLIRSGQGYHNLPNLGVSVWRIDSNGVELGDAFKVAPDNFTFDPFGRDLPIFTVPATVLDAFEPTSEEDIADRLSFRVLDNELRKKAEGLESVHFGSQPTFQIFLDGSATPVDPINIHAADLRSLTSGAIDWRVPAALASPGDPVQIAVDPVLGRIATSRNAVTSVKVNYYYGTPGNLGGGYKLKQDSTVVPSQKKVTVRSLADIANEFTNWDPTLYPDLHLILDTDDTLVGNLTLSGRNATVTLEPAEGKRPCLNGNIRISATVCPNKVTIKGLWIKGQVQTPKTLKSLLIQDCSLLVTGQVSILTAADSEDLEIEVSRSKIGACKLDGNIVKATFTDCIIHELNGRSLSDTWPKAAPPLTIINCTIFGAVKAKQLDLVSESILLAPALAERTQTGCIRFSWLPLASRVPRRFYCQPNLEAASLKAESPSLAQTIINQHAMIATYPRFESKDPHSVAYAQLGHGCPETVSRGSEDQGEMGAWHFLFEQERISNFMNALDEYLRFGIDAGLIKRT